MTTRPVAVLMGLGTYQGMTDVEIESVIAYKVDQALKNAELADALQRSTEYLNGMADAARSRIIESDRNMKGAGR